MAKQSFKESICKKIDKNYASKKFKTQKLSSILKTVL